MSPVSGPGETSRISRPFGKQFKIMKLSVLAVLIGLLFGLPNLYGMLKPKDFGAALRQFPRYTPAGYVLILLATFWFLHYVRLEDVADFVAFKPLLYALFIGVGLGACLFLRDFLPVRGLAVLLLLLAKLVVDTARWVETEWRLVMVGWAYVWIMAGMWLTISPWRLRDLINWGTATPERTRLLSGLRLAFALLIIVLGLTVYRQAEARPAAGVAFRHHPQPALGAQPLAWAPVGAASGRTPQPA